MRSGATGDLYRPCPGALDCPRDAWMTQGQAYLSLPAAQATTLAPLKILRLEQPLPLHLVQRWIAPSASIVSLSQAMFHAGRR